MTPLGTSVVTDTPGVAKGAPGLDGEAPGTHEYFAQWAAITVNITGTGEVVALIRAQIYCNCGGLSHYCSADVCQNKG